MSKLTVTAKGQITLRGELLRHLGVEPGQRIETHKLPNGRVEISAVPKTRSIEAFFGILDGRTDRTATLEEIEETIKAGWAGER